VLELCKGKKAGNKKIGHIGNIAMTILVAGICAIGFTCLINILFYISIK
jgi:hypothetical protein